MPEDGVVVHDEVAVGGGDRIVRRQDERVDLRRAGVFGPGHFVELGQELGRLEHDTAGEPGPADEVAGFELAEPQTDIDRPGGDLLGVPTGNFLDARPPDGAENEDRAFPGVIHHQAGEEFGFNRKLLLDQDPIDREMADLHPDQPAGLLHGLLRRVGELDPSEAGPAREPDLNLQDDRPPDPPGDLPRLGRREGDLALGDADAAFPKERLALILVKSSHEYLPCSRFGDGEEG
jgi:hypothetical protein